MTGAISYSFHPMGVIPGYGVSVGWEIGFEECGGHLWSWFAVNLKYGGLSNGSGFDLGGLGSVLIISSVISHYHLPVMGSTRCAVSQSLVGLLGGRVESSRIKEEIRKSKGFFIFSFQQTKRKTFTMCYIKFPEKKTKSLWLRRSSYMATMKAARGMRRSYQRKKKWKYLRSTAT